MIPSRPFHAHTQPLKSIGGHAPVLPPADLFHTPALGPLYHGTTRAAWFADTTAHGPKLLFLCPDKAVAHAKASAPLTCDDVPILAFFSSHLLALLQHRLAPLPDSGTDSWQQSLLTVQAVLLLPSHESLADQCPITPTPRSVSPAA